MSMLVNVHVTTEAIQKNINLFWRIVYCYYYLENFISTRGKNHSSNQTLCSEWNLTASWGHKVVQMLSYHKFKKKSHTMLIIAVIIVHF